MIYTPVLPAPASSLDVEGAYRYISEFHHMYFPVLIEAQGHLEELHKKPNFPFGEGYQQWLKSVEHTLELTSRLSGRAALANPNMYLRSLKLLSSKGSVRMIHDIISGPTHSDGEAWEAPFRENILILIFAVNILLYNQQAILH